MSDWLATHSTAPRCARGWTRRCPRVPTSPRRTFAPPWSAPSRPNSAKRPPPPKSTSERRGRGGRGEADPELDESDVDAARRIVTAMEAVGVGSKGTEPTGDIAAQVATDKTRALARELGARDDDAQKREHRRSAARQSDPTGSYPYAATRTAASSWSDRPIRVDTAAARWRPAIR